MKSIFDLENRLDIQKEFNRFVSVFHKIECIGDFNIYQDITVIEYFNRYCFKEWKYRDTMLSVSEYLEFIGVTKAVLNGNKKIDEIIFLRYIEFIKNMIFQGGYTFINRARSSLLKATLDNINLILEKMNYTYKELDDRVILIKRDADVDSVIKEVSKDIVNVLLEYNDFRIENDIQEKKNLLKQLDLYIEENIKVKEYDTELNNTIGMIVNKMGVNHPINEEPYLSLTDDELLEWYDKCFELMIHAIRLKRIKEIKEERKKLINNK